MTMSNEDYAQENIREIPFGKLFAEFRETFSRAAELERQMNEAYFDGDIGLSFAYASELGVLTIRVQIMQAEVERRDEEDGPLTPEESAEAQAAVFDELLKSLFR